MNNVYTGPRFGLYPGEQNQPIRQAYSRYAIREHQAGRKPDTLSRWLLSLILIGIEVIEGEA